MADSRIAFTTTSHRQPFQSNAKRDINVLILGETGIGKSTFINAFPNYLVFDTLDEACEGTMQALIPSKFSVTDPDTFNTQNIIISKPSDDNESYQVDGESQTQGCKTYTFPIGNRFLRLIDAPGVGDCRGVTQDNLNFDHIFTYISRYEHLNAIFILFKPNQERLTIPMRYCILETLKYLPVGIVNNIIFVFTYAQATFFAPGSTTKLLRALLNEIKGAQGTDIPFDKSNSFFFDNETFRYLAVHHAGHRFFEEQKPNFIQYWDKSITELKRLMKKLVQCPPYSMEQLKSVNEAYQLIRRLPRPIAEVVKFIQENLQLGKEHENKLMRANSETHLDQLPSNSAEVLRLQQPCLVCTNDQCSKLNDRESKKTLDNKVICLQPYFISESENESLKRTAIRRSQIMNRLTGKCRHCDCDWDTHRHISYDIKKHVTHVRLSEQPRAHPSDRLLGRLQFRMKRLKDEQDIIRYICTQLTLYLQMNSISPTNEEVIDYIQYSIQELKVTPNANEKTRELIQGLQNMIDEYQKEIELLRKDVGKNTTEAKHLPTIHDVFACKVQLCELPITGKYMTDQLRTLESHDQDIDDNREEYVQLPRCANNSMIMQQLKQDLA